VGRDDEQSLLLFGSDSKVRRLNAKGFREEIRIAREEVQDGSLENAMAEAVQKQVWKARLSGKQRNQFQGRQDALPNRASCVDQGYELWLARAGTRNYYDGRSGGEIWVRRFDRRVGW